MTRVREPSPAVAVFLPWLRQGDADREARMIMLIAGGPGPDVFEAGIPDLVTDLNGVGPTAAELQHLVDRTREVTDETALRVPEQHVVSKVLFKQFCRAPTGGRGYELQALDLRWGKSRARTPTQVGKVIDFVKIDSAATEALWQEVENKLSGAFASLQSGDILDHPEHVLTIKRAIALHFARSHEILEMSQRIWNEGIARQREALRGVSWMIDQALAHRYKGLTVTGPEAVELALDEMTAGTRRLTENGTIFRLRVEDMYEQARETVDRAGLQIIRPERGEFLIGDTPAVTVDHARKLIGVRAGVPFASANTVALPLGRFHLAGLAKEDAWVTMPAAMVQELNRWQILQAKSHVFFHPSSGLESFVRSIRPPISRDD